NVATAAFFDGAREEPFGCRLAQSQVGGLNALISAWEAGGDGDNRKLAYLLATAFHECAATMQPISERGAVRYFAKYDAGTKLGKALGNTLSGDGYRFRGRGYVQLTGRANYVSAGSKLGVDLAANPDLALAPDIAAKIIVRGMSEAWFTGKKLSDYINSGHCDFVAARKIINGTDRAVLIAGYANDFLTA